MDNDTEQLPSVWITQNARDVLEAIEAKNPELTDVELKLEELRLVIDGILQHLDESPK